jgi:hypothetical protein
VNLNCPNLLYNDPGKIKMDIAPFHEILTRMLTKATKKISRLVSRGQSGSQRVTQIGEALRVLPQAINKASSNGNYQFKQRQLWYVVRSMLGPMCPEYKYFTGDVLDEAFKVGIAGLEDLLKEANSELHEPRSGSSLSLSTKEEAEYEIPEYSYNKVIYIEKRGFKDVIIANGFHDRFDIAVIGSQGESSEASRRLLRRIEDEAKRRGEKVTLICVHDADREGHGIYQTLREGSDGRWLDLKDFGLSLFEAVDLGLEFEEVLEKKPIAFPKKLVENLREYELQLLTGSTREKLRTEKIKRLNRVELNAMTPEVFLRWLEGKLRELGIEGKVRPPDDVVFNSSSAIIKKKLEEIVREELERSVGAREIIDSCVIRIMQDGGGAPDCTAKLDDTLAQFPTDGWKEIVGKLGVQQAVDSAKEACVRDLVSDELSKHLSQYRCNFGVK